MQGVSGLVAWIADRVRRRRPTAQQTSCVELALLDSERNVQGVDGRQSRSSASSCGAPRDVVSVESPPQRRRKTCLVKRSAGTAASKKHVRIVLPCSRHAGASRTGPKKQVRFTLPPSSPHEPIGDAGAPPSAVDVTSAIKDVSKVDGIDLSAQCRQAQVGQLTPVRGMGEAILDLHASVDSDTLIQSFCRSAADNLDLIAALIDDFEHCSC